jgi:hypothetical protein
MPWHFLIASQVLYSLSVGAPIDVGLPAIGQSSTKAQSRSKAVRKSI